MDASPLPNLYLSFLHLFLSHHCLVEQFVYPSLLFSKCKCSPDPRGRRSSSMLLFAGYTQMSFLVEHIYLFIGVLPANVFVYHTYTVTAEARRGCGILWNWSYSHCEPLCGCRELGCSSLQEQQLPFNC